MYWASPNKRGVEWHVSDPHTLLSFCHTFCYPLLSLFLQFSLSQCFCHSASLFFSIHKLVWSTHFFSLKFSSPLLPFLFIFCILHTSLVGFLLLFSPHTWLALWLAHFSTCSWYVVSALAPLSCVSRRIIQVDAAHWWWLRRDTPHPPPTWL